MKAVIYYLDNRPWAAAVTHEGVEHFSADIYKAMGSYHIGISDGTAIPNALHGTYLNILAVEQRTKPDSNDRLLNTIETTDYKLKIIKPWAVQPQSR